MSTLIGDGEMPSALTDLRDIGRYIAAIITDERTLNRYVLAYNELLRPNQVYSKLETLAGERIPRNYLSEAQLHQIIAESDEKLKSDPHDFSASMGKVSTEYQLSWGIRGENTPEYAKYLGYLTSKDLYPDLSFTSFDDFLEEVVAGKAKAVYSDNEAMKEAMHKLQKK